MMIDPESGTSSPATSLRIVVLPQPDGPISTKRSPRSTDRDNSLITAWRSYVFENDCNSTAVMGDFAQFATTRKIFPKESPWQPRESHTRRRQDSAPRSQ